MPGLVEVAWVADPAASVVLLLEVDQLLALLANNHSRLARPIDLAASLRNCRTAIIIASVWQPFHLFLHLVGLQDLFRR